MKLRKLIRPKWDSVPDFQLTTSKVSEAWLSDPVLRTTLLCWILKGGQGMKTKEVRQGSRAKPTQCKIASICQNNFKESGEFYDHSI